MLQPPHLSQPEVRGAASKTGAGAVGAKKLAQHRPSSNSSAKKLAPRARKRRFWAILSAQGELFRAHAHIRPRRANFFAHEARQRGDVETNNTSAHPQQGSLETGIASAPEKRTKNAHFPPAKATTVSIDARPAPAKATTVSVEARPAPAKAIAVSLPHRHKRAKATTVSVEARPAPAKAIAVSLPHRHKRAKAMAVSIGARPAPAKAMTVSVEARPTPAKATPVSDNQPPGRHGLAAVPVGGGGAWPGFEIDRSEPQARVWRSRGRAAAHEHTKQPGPTAGPNST